MHLMRCKSGNSPSCTGRPRGPAKGEPPRPVLVPHSRASISYLSTLVPHEKADSDRFAETTTGTQREVERGHTGHMHYMLKKHTHVSAYGFVRILNESRSVFLSHSGLPFIIHLDPNESASLPHPTHTPPTPHLLISSSPRRRPHRLPSAPPH